MFARLSACAALCFSALVVVVVATDTPSTATLLPLYHRLVPSGVSRYDTGAPWARRGVIHLDTARDEAWLEEDELAVEAQERIDQGEAGQAYQIAVGEEQERKVISVDACMLFHRKSLDLNELLVLVMGPEPANELEGLNYLTNSNEACPKSAPGGSDAVPKEAFEEFGHGSVDVKVDRGYVPDAVRFKTEDPKNPIKVGADGKVIAPPPEKSFIQKYWIYIVPVLVIMMMGGGEEAAAPPKK